MEALPETRNKGNVTVTVGNYIPTQLYWNTQHETGKRGVCTVAMSHGKYQRLKKY